MKIAIRSYRVTARLISGVCLIGGALLLCLPCAAINAVVPATAAVEPEAQLQQAALPPRYSAGIADVLRMADAEVDPSVIQAFVRSSPVAYNLNAAEIIALKDRGISSDILTAMIQRGGELRGQAMRAGQAAAGPMVQQAYPATVNPYAPAPAYDYGAQTAYPAYTYPAYSYAYPDYSYSYPAYSYASLGIGFGGYWGGCWPSAYWGCFPYCSYGYGRYCGYGYPGYWGSRGYGYYNGNRSYYGTPGYYGNRGYYGYPHYSGAYRGGSYGSGVRPAPSAGRTTGFNSVGFAGRSAGFSGHSGSFGGHAVSVGGRGVSVGGHAGGFGGHSGGRGR
jgi:hypothetical protein